MLKPLFAFTNEPFILYFEPGNTYKNQLKKLKIVFGGGLLHLDPYQVLVLNPSPKFLRYSIQKDVGKYANEAIFYLADVVEWSVMLDITTWIKDVKTCNWTTK
jgi:hypothetical protein